MHTTVSSADKTLTIGSDQPFCIIGERINPTGRKTFQEQLRSGDLSAVEKDVADQIAGGAMMLDVNMGAPLVDEAALLAEAVRLIQRLTDVPRVSTRRLSRRSRRVLRLTKAKHSSTRSRRKTSASR